MVIDDKIAVVTGGGSGIGRATCLRFAEDRIAVAVWDLKENLAQETVAMVQSAGGTAIACVVDASKSDRIAEAAQATREKLGAVTILVNNAGISEFEPILAISEEAWDRMMAINLKGPFLCAQALLPDMFAAGWGRIINISSSSAQQGSPGTCRYASSKGGVIGFTKSLAAELARTGVTVNNIPPGFIDTPMLRASSLDVEARAQERPMGRPGRPECIAEACAWLVSENSDYVTGQTIGVNGGYYMS